MKILIDPQAGFCPGVKRAIDLAEKGLEKNKHLFSLGGVIHNPVENKRLESKGLKIVDIHFFDRKSASRDIQNLLIRAHGEPPATYVKAQKAGLNLIDGTCPIVKRSQRMTKNYSQKGFQIVIIGKPNHPEVLGIIGQCKKPAVVVYEEEDLNKLDTSMKTFVLAQTTISFNKFQNLISAMQDLGLEITIYNSICPFVSDRNKQVQTFAQKCDLLILVGGKNSSNTKVLYESCRAVTANLHWIENSVEIQKNWIINKKVIGISGGASTPHWLLAETKDYLLNL